MNVALCPDRGKLESYALGKLAPNELDAVAEHLLACPDCDRVVESLESASDSIVAELRSPPLADPLAEEPQLQRAVAAICSRFTRRGVGGEDPSSSAIPKDSSQPGLGGIREYRFVKKLGQGGMGTVYKAVHSKLKSTVAVKLLPRERRHDQEAIRRFAREMEAVGKLAHPNIVRALDAGEEQGRHYLVIEYVEGTDLKSYIKSKGTLSVRQTARVGCHVAEALAHARKHGIIHRDVKPSNILLSTSGEVKLADLGLAKFFDESLRPVSSNTMVGELLGSIDYLAPEQAKDASQADTRSDIYALGCTLYHCLTGRPPFVEGTNVQKIMAHIETEPEAIVDLNPAVPEELARLIHTRMLAKRPEDRFQTPTEVALALRPWAEKAASLSSSSVMRVAEIEASGSTHSRLAASVDTRSELSRLDHGDAVQRRSKALPQRRRAGRIRGLRRKSRVADYLERTRALLHDWKVIGQYVLAESAAEPAANDLERYSTAREGILMQYDSLLPILQRRSGPGGHQTLAACAKFTSLYEVEELGANGRQKLRDDWQRGHDYLVDFLLFLEQVRARLNALNPVSYAVGAAWDIPVVRIVAVLLLLLGGAYPLSAVVLKVNTSIGTVVLEIDQPEIAGAFVSIDDKLRIFIRTAADQEPVEIGVEEGRRMLKVSKAGFETFTEEFTIKAKDRKIIRVHLERESALGKSPAPGGERPIPAPGGERPTAPSVAQPPEETVTKPPVADPEVWVAAAEVRQFVSERVHGVAFTPDGRRVIGAGWTRPVFVWDRNTGQTIQELTPPSDYIYSMAVSPDGRRLLGGYRNDHNLALWNLGTGQRSGRMTGHTGPVRSLAFSPNSRRALSGSEDGTVRLWDVDGEAELARLEHGAPVRAVAYSPDGRRALSGGGGIIRLWDLEGREQVRQFDHDALSLAFVSESRALAGDGDGLIRLWDVETGDELLRIDKHFDDVHGLAVSPDGRYALSGSRDATARLWDLESGWELRRMQGHSQEVLSVALSPDVRYALSGSFDGTVRLWDLGDLGTPTAKRRATPTVTAPVLYGGVAMRTPYSALKPGTIVTLDPASGAATSVGLPAVGADNPFGVTGIAFNSKGELFASVYARDGLQGRTSLPPTLIRVDPDTGALLDTIGAIRDSRRRSVKITDLAMQPETDVLFGIGGGSVSSVRNPADTGVAKLYRIDTSTAVATLVGDTKRSFGGAIAFSPTGTLYHATFMGPWQPREERKPALAILDPANGRLIKSIPLKDGTQKTHLIVPRGLAVRPGDDAIFVSMNYALSDDRPITELQNNLLATIDPETGVVTRLASSVEDVRNRIGDLAFRPGAVGAQPVAATPSSPSDPVEEGQTLVPEVRNPPGPTQTEPTEPE